MSLKTNLGVRHAKLWIKPDGEFHDEILKKFLEDVEGFVVIVDGLARFFYGSIPKFLVYVMSTIK